MNKFKLTVEKMNSEKVEIIETREADTRKEALKIRRELLKKYSLINHGGYFVNYSDRMELTTNF
jgi:uncharacterized protein YjdB